MTVADARISTALPSHPKTKKLIRRLGPSGGWALVCLFLWVASNRSDGGLSGMTDEDIELAADWDGEPGALVTALAEVGFLDGAEGTYSVHDWADHQPWAAGAAFRSAKARWNAVKGHHGEAEADLLVPEYAAIRHGQRAGSRPSSKADSSGDSNADSKAPSSAGSSAPLLSVSSPSPLPSPTCQPPAGSEALRKRRALPGVDRPDEVAEQVWNDWLTLRRKKSAPVTATVVEGAQEQARLAGMTLEAFLRVWCRRGSQGLEAAWLKPDERGQQAETTYQRTMRERMQEAAPEAARKDPSHAAHAADFFNTIEVPARAVERIR